MVGNGRSFLLSILEANGPMVVHQFIGRATSKQKGRRSCAGLSEIPTQLQAEWAGRLDNRCDGGENHTDCNSDIAGFRFHDHLLFN